MKVCDFIFVFICLPKVHLGLAIAPWNVLGAGRVRSDEEEKKRRETGENGRLSMTGWERSEAERNVCLVLEDIAPKVGTKHITAGSYISGLRTSMQMITHLQFI